MREVVMRSLRRDIWGVRQGAFYTLEVNVVSFWERVWYKLWGEKTGRIRITCDHFFNGPLYYESNEAILRDWEPVNQSHPGKRK